MYFLPNFILLLLFILPLAANCQSELFQQFAKEEIESLREYLHRTNPTGTAAQKKLNAEKIVKIVADELEEHNKKVFKNCLDFEACKFWMNLKESIKKWLNYLPKAANPKHDPESAYLCEITVRPFVSSNAIEGENAPPLETVKIIEIILSIKSKEQTEIPMSKYSIGGWQNEKLIKWMEGKTTICKDGHGSERQKMRSFLHSILNEEQQAIMGKKPKFESENYNERVKNNQ